MNTVYYQMAEVNEVSVADENGTMTVINAGSDIQTLDLDELANVSGCGGHQSGSQYNRHRSETKGSTFANAEGSGSTFSHKEEDISSAASDISWD